jgi:hypothetical protein
MKNAPYPFTSIDGRTFFFTSTGKANITKVVEFTPTDNENIVNLGFGDVMPEGDYSDLVVSDNGDLLKVMTTVVHIILYFTALFPQSKIGFTGSSPARMRLYNRILNNYYAEFKKMFTITASIHFDGLLKEMAYTPGSADKHASFFIKKKQ